MLNVCCKSVKHNLLVPEGSTLKYWLKAEPWAFYPAVLEKSSLGQSPNKCICTGLYHQIASNWMFYAQSTRTVTSGQIKSQENVLYIERMLCISFFKQNSTKRSSPQLAFDCRFQQEQRIIILFDYYSAAAWNLACGIDSLPLLLPDGQEIGIPVRAPAAEEEGRRWSRPSQPRGGGASLLLSVVVSDPFGRGPSLPPAFHSIWNCRNSSPKQACVGLLQQSQVLGCWLAVPEAKIPVLGFKNK